MNILHISYDYKKVSQYPEMLRALGEIGVDSAAAAFTETGRHIPAERDVTDFAVLDGLDKMFYYSGGNKCYKALKKRMTLRRFSLVHAHSLFSAGIIAHKVYDEYDIPYVASVRNSDINLFFKKFPGLRSFGVKLMLEAKAVIFTSNVKRDKAIEKYVPAEYRDEIKAKCFTVANGVSDFWLSSASSRVAPASGRALVLGYAGAVGASSRVNVAVKAAEVLRSRGVDTSLSVAYTSANKADVQRLDRQKGVSTVKCADRTELDAFYRGIDILIIPGFERSYTEAMSRGAPVIYIRGQGFDGQFAEGEVGYSVGGSDENEVADRIQAVLRNYTDMSKSCKKLCNGFSWANTAENLLKVYVFAVK